MKRKFSRKLAKTLHAKVDRKLVIIILALEVLVGIALAWFSKDPLGSFLGFLAVVISLTLVLRWRRGQKEDEELPRKVRRVPEDRTY